jgi:hypothetical protein
MEGKDGIDQQIALDFAKHEADPGNGAISKAIAALYVQKNDYASAIAWYTHAFESGGRVDSALETIIGDLQLRGHAESN